MLLAMIVYLVEEIDPRNVDDYLNNKILWKENRQSLLENTEAPGIVVETQRDLVSLSGYK